MVKALTKNTIFEDVNNTESYGIHKPTEKERTERGRGGGGVGQSYGATQEKSSPGCRVSNGNLDDMASKRNTQKIQGSRI